MVPGLIDTSLFYLIQKNVRLYVLIYVDDILVTGSHPPAIQQLISSLSSEFAVRDLGPARFFLGIELRQHPEGMVLTQSTYI